MMYEKHKCPNDQCGAIFIAQPKIKDYRGRAEKYITCPKCGKHILIGSYRRSYHDFQESY